MERDDLSGAVLDGRYRVIEPVAEGAMGVVYRAERVKLGRIVAIKVLHDVLPDELSGRKRFEIEAMAMAKLEHPHCASVLDVGVHNDRPFVVMDFVSGQNLKELISSGPLPIPRAVEIVRQVLSGLGHAHEHGIIHRDIKPANLVLSQKTGLGDHVKILDFGLARVLDTSQNLTAGLAVGTPAYMAPEQVRGDKLDHRADLYACGVLMFELLTGRKPFQSDRDDPIEVCKMHLSDPIPRLDSKLPGVDFGELEAVVTKALAKRARKRYASAEDYAAALDAAVGRPLRQATQPSRLVRPPQPTAPLPVEPPAERSSVESSSETSDSPPLEIDSGDVMSTEPASWAAAEARAAMPVRGRLATPAAGVDAVAADARALQASLAGANSRMRLATPPAGVAAASAEPRMLARAPSAGVSARLPAAETTSAGDRERPVTPASVDVAASAAVAAPASVDVAASTATPASADAVAATPAPGASAASMSAAAGAKPVGTFLGMVVSRTPIPGPRPLAAAPAPRAAPLTPATREPTQPRRWRRLVLVLAGVALAAGVAVLVVELRRPPPAPGPTAPPAEPRRPAAASTEIVARATELVAQGDKDAALEVLNRARRKSPDNAALAYATGRVYFQKYYWTEGLRNFRDAIRNDPSYRADQELIKTVVRGFVTTPSYNDDLASFLHDDIGAASRPVLEETARTHPSPSIRTRVTNELRRYH